MSKLPKFIDSLCLRVKGGSGGMGLPTYGGVGGKGGDVYIEAAKKSDMKLILQKFSKLVVTAGRGEDSKKMRIFGEDGKDKVISVPPGVAAFDEWKRKLGEVNEIGDKLLVAQGGVGGSPTSEPPFSGGRGVERTIILDLKLIADVGFVGFPNAGKSTLLKAISRAKPEIAAYAFTTLKPNLGVVSYPDRRQISMADLPGLVEGASYNIGMGHQFLKHVERTKLLLLVVDIKGFQLNPIQKHRTCLETVLLLNKELELYKKELLDKPAMLVVNKMDLPGSVNAFQEIEPHLKDLTCFASTVPEEMRPNRLLNFEEILTISAKNDGSSVQLVKEAIRRVMDLYYFLDHNDEMIKTERKLFEKWTSSINQTGQTQL